MKLLIHECILRQPTRSFHAVHGVYMTAKTIYAAGMTVSDVLSMLGLMLHCVIVKSVRLVDLTEMRKTDCFGETRHVLHALAHHELKSECIIVIAIVLGHACNRKPQDQAASIRILYITLGHTHKTTCLTSPVAVGMDVCCEAQ